MSVSFSCDFRRSLIPFSPSAFRNFEVVNKKIDIREELAENWLPDIYAAKVRPQRTRSVHIDVPLRENAAEIQYTLLGIEVKVGKRRFACPDLATARYMRVFARLGVLDFAVPYDITKISVVADELETAWQRTILLADARSRTLSEQARKRFRNQLIKAIRTEIAEIGAGDAMPAFDKATSQRNK